MRMVVTILLCGMSFCFSGKPVFSRMAYTMGEKASYQYTHLTDTNQSQIVEPMSAPNSLSYRRYASVHFITNSNNQIFDFKDDTADNCKKNGYNKPVAECQAAGQKPARLCPYNNEYADTCCSNDYKYEKKDCSYPQTLGTSCGDKYQCYCDRSLYPWGTDKACPAPQVYETADSCTIEGKTYYAKCKCPDNYNLQCSGTNQQGKGTACTLNGNTAYTACQCKSGYTLTCSDYGPDNASDYCELSGIKYYKSCKNCAAPSGYDKAACTSEQAFLAQQEVCGITYYSCRTQQAGDILYSDRTVSPEILAEKTPVGVVFSPAKHLAVALEQKNTSWGAQITLPDVKCKNKTCDLEGEDVAKSGKKNTLYLMGIKADKSASFPAAEYADAYVPDKVDSSSWCGKGKWFLPSNNEWFLFNAARNNVNKTLAKLNMTQFVYSTNYWSSNTSKYDEMSFTYYLGNGDYILVENRRNLSEHGTGDIWKHYSRPIIDYGNNCDSSYSYPDTSCGKDQYILGQMMDDKGTACYICRNTDKEVIVDTCRGDDNSDTDLSSSQNGNNCLSCTNSEGKQRYICSCTSTSIYNIITPLGYKRIAVPACPQKASCSNKMCDNNYYLKGCLRDDGTISSTFNDGDRVFCKKTNTCDKIEFREDSQGSRSGVVIDGDDTVVIPIPGMISSCDTCSLVGYYSSQPSGKICKSEKINGVTCYKQCCENGYTFDANGSNGKNCYTCTNGVYNISAHKCDCNEGYTPSGVDAAVCCKNGYVHDPNGKQGNMCYKCDNGKPYDATLHRCPCSDGYVYDENGSSGANCYNCTGGATYNPATHKCEN